jgi:hypothetical protein
MSYRLTGVGGTAAFREERPRRAGDSVARSKRAAVRDDPALERQADTAASRALLRAGGMTAAATAPGGGPALDLATRMAMETGFGRSFADVRVHTGPDAATSAREFGARAYTFGNDIVFGAREWAPATPQGRRLLAHELAHVAQQQSSDRPVVQRQPPAAHAPADTRLAAALVQIRTIGAPFTPQAKAERALAFLTGIDLTNPNNLDPVIATLTEITATFERGAVLAAFLALVDAAQPGRPLPQTAPTPEDEERMRRQIAMMQVQPRGPYGQVGPGVALPVLSQAARPLLPLVEAVGNAFEGAGAFLHGLLDGLSGALSAADREQLATRLLQSTVLTVIFPPVFAAGAVVGVVEDVVDAVKGLYNLITNFREFLGQMHDLAVAFLGPDARAIGEALGQEVGRSYGTRIATLARENVFSFTFGLGRMIGPTIIYTILGMLGVPELIAAAIVERLMVVLRPILSRFPRLLAILERIAARIVRTSTSTTMSELDRDLERSFAATFTEPAPAAAAGAATTVAPEVAAGFLQSQLPALRRLLGQALLEGDLGPLRRVWLAVGNAGEEATLTLANSRGLFDNRRTRFWRAVLSDPAARRLIEEAGFTFTGAAGTAPTRTLTGGRVMQCTIDHIVERQTDPSRALDPSNLRVVSRLENTTLLRQLHAQDPFLR